MKNSKLFRKTATKTEAVIEKLDKSLLNKVTGGADTGTAPIDVPLPGSSINTSRSNIRPGNS
jgi:hypothetical protein